MSRPAKAIISLEALRHNYLLAKDIAKGHVVAVVKADAYSHGATVCAQALADCADAFAVACIEEALELREAGIRQPIILLEGFFDMAELQWIDQYRLDTVVHHESQIAAIRGARLKNPLRIWLKMDTGMSRIGFLPEQYHKVWQELKALPQVADIVLMSHLACADEPDISHTLQQLQTFQTYTLGLTGDKSIANSAGLIAFPAARAQWSRPGLMLYGVSPFTENHSIEQRLMPVMTLHSSLISIKDIAPGSTVGYGSTWVAQRPTRLGVVAMGYADGYPRHAKNGTPVLVNGQRVPLVGRVSMDMLTVDLTGLDQVRIGDDVTLWGDRLPIATVARHADSIAYQLLCNLNRVPIEYQPLPVTPSESSRFEANKVRG